MASTRARGWLRLRVGIGVVGVVFVDRLVRFIVSHGLPPSLVLLNLRMCGARDWVCGIEVNDIDAQ